MWNNMISIDERTWLHIEREKDELYNDFLNELHSRVNVISSLNSDRKKREFVVESDDKEAATNVIKNLNALKEKYSGIFTDLNTRKSKGFEDDGTHVGADQEIKVEIKSTARQKNLSINHEPDINREGIETNTGIPKSNDFGSDDTSREPFKCDTCSGVMQTKDFLLCGHPYCQKCMKNNKSRKTVCQVCDETFEELMGYNIDGLMGCQTLNKDKGNLDGHEGEGIIKIKFIIGDGVQEDNHPNPSKGYRGLRMRAFLPDSEEGRSLHKLIRKAYDNGVLFFIDKRPHGSDQVLVNNRITLKSNQKTFPDPGYFPLLKHELALFGLYPC